METPTITPTVVSESVAPKKRSSHWGRWLTVTVLVALVGAMFWERDKIVSFLKPSAITSAPRIPPAELVKGKGQTLIVRPETLQTLGIQWAPVTASGESASILLSGKLFIDPSRLVSSHARFSGEVVRIGVCHANDNVGSPSGTPDLTGESRLCFGNRVKAGQLLVVIWSKEVGDQKSDLMDAISRLQLDERTLNSLKAIESTGAVTERTVREAQRNYEADFISSIRAERTLRSWRFKEDEINAIKEDATRLHTKNSTPNADLERRWAEVEILAPIDGTIVEHDVAVGDVVDAGDVLFKIADLSRMGVVANLYEDDLPRLLALSPEQRKMTVQLASDPNMPAVSVPITRIGDVVDPNQHTLAVMGWIDNHDEKLRSGQFITANIPLSAETGMVKLPVNAVIDEGKTSVVFVSPSEGSPEFTRRRIAVARRTADSIFVRTEPTVQERASGAEPLHAGEWVASTGILSLDGVLTELEATNSPSVSVATKERD